MYTINLSSLESPDPRFSQDDEYSQDFNTEIDYEDEILSDYADESYNEVEFSVPDEESYIRSIRTILRMITNMMKLVYLMIK